MLDKNKVERFIEAALKYMGDAYSQLKRMDKGFSDCSSLIYKGLIDSKLLDNSQTTRTISTLYMKDGDPRFKLIDMKDLERGDILWGGDFVNGKWSGHVAIYMGNGKTFEAVKAGVKHMTNRPYFTRAYRIKSLEQTTQKPVAPVKPQVIENVGVVVMGKETKVKGYIVNQKTHIEMKLDGKDIVIPVREFYEKLGFKVDYDDKNKKVIVS